MPHFIAARFGIFVFLLVLFAGPILSAPARAEPFDPSTFDPAAPPAFLFGESVEAHEAVFAAECSAQTLQTFDPAEMPLAEISHEQVDCEGFAYYGAPRLAEFVFVDGALTHVWVLTGAEDLAGMRAAFEAAFGTPDHNVEGMFTTFIGHGAVVRYDIPEALYFAEAVTPAFAAWFDGMAEEAATNIQSAE